MCFDTFQKYLVEQDYQFAYANSGRDLLSEKSKESGSGVYVFAGQTTTWRWISTHSRTAMSCSTGRRRMPWLRVCWRDSVSRMPVPTELHWQ